MQIGIVGLPFSGKSTLFQAVTKTQLDPAMLAKGEAHIGVVKVPDKRLEKCAEIFNPKKTVHATIEFVDAVGLAKGGAGSSQFSTAFFSAVKNNDAVVHVVRLFEDDAVPHPDGAINAMRDIETFDTEFILADMAILEPRIDRIQKQLHRLHDENLKKELPLLERCLALLQEEKVLRNEEFDEEEQKILRTYQLLSLKPMLIALNLDESQLAIKDAEISRVEEAKKGLRTGVAAFFGKIDMEISQLSDEDARVFLDEYGIDEPALHTLIREAYSLLGLQSFLTVGEDECRAWTIRKGYTAQDAAGVIHSDFYDKFIRAEVVHYDDFIEAGGSFAKAKETGHWRLEGKNYVVEDGDIMEIRHG